MSKNAEDFLEKGKEALDAKTGKYEEHKVIEMAGDGAVFPRRVIRWYLYLGV